MKSFIIILMKYLFDLRIIPTNKEIDSQTVVNLSPHVAGQHQKTSEQSHEHDGLGGNG